MELDPALPCGLCRSCSDKTLAAITFKNLCAMSAHHWAEAANYISQPPTPTEDDKAFFIFYNNEKTIVKDQIARVPTTKDAEDRLNMKWVKPVKIRKPRRHGLIKESCKCPDCGKKFSTPDYLNYHLRNTLKRACQECRMVVYKKKLAKHLLTNHNIQLFECNICNKLFEEEESMRQHCDEAHGKLMHTCSHCGNSFVNERALRAHIHSHSLFHCSSCNMSYDNVKCFKYHQQVCEFLHRPSVEFKFFTCDHCGVTYNRKPSLRIGEVGPKRMHEENLIPLGACVTCASTALAAQEFRLFVRSSDKLWRKALVNLTTLPNTAAPPAKSVFAFVKPSDLSIQTFKDYNTNDPKAILNRLKNRVTKKPIERKPRGARTGPSCCCPDCGKGFLSPYYLNMHLRNSGHKEACLTCGSVFVRGKDMQEHLASAHNEIVFLCKKCPILCPNETQLKKHVQKAHKAGAFTCTDCGRTFPRHASFETHSQMHAVRTCRACGVQFTNRGCYREHRAQCEPDAKPNAANVPRNRRSNIRDPATFTCDHCGKTYNSRPQLKNHILWIHMDIRPHQCTWCGKRFYTHARLAEHNVVHTRARNFECDICGAKLVSKMAAVYHRRRHTGERPYECEDCGEKFISASRRSEHAKRRHNKGYRLPCPKCPANFVRRHELNKHLEKAHKGPENVLSWAQP